MHNFGVGRRPSEEEPPFFLCPSQSAHRCMIEMEFPLYVCFCDCFFTNRFLLSANMIWCFLSWFSSLEANEWQAFLPYFEERMEAENESRYLQWIGEGKAKRQKQIGLNTRKLIPWPIIRVETQYFLKMKPGLA